MTPQTHDTVPTQFVEARGIRFAYRRFGAPARTPIVFLQHFMGNLDDHDPVLSDGLATDREVILFNNTGVSSTSGLVPETIEEMAFDAAAFIDALGLPRVDRQVGCATASRTSRDLTEFAQVAAPYPNVYAEIGTTFASCVVTFPTVAAHVLGILFKYLGADRILWGTDSIWYGSPQWQIEAFWRIQIPEEFRRRFGYPELTHEMKRKVLGLNSARLYRMTPDAAGHQPLAADYRERVEGDADLMRLMEYDTRLPADPPAPAPYGPAVADRDDLLGRARAAYREQETTRFGVPRDNTRSGWIRTR